MENLNFPEGAPETVADPPAPEKPSTGETTSRRGKAFLLFGSTILSLVVLELGLRAILPSPGGEEMNVPDPEIGKTLRPGYEGVQQGVEVRINSHGMRGPEIPLEKPEGTFRILVLGDSWTFGVGTSQEETYPSRLENILRERYPGRGIDVLNAGVSGYETYNEAVWFRRIGKRFRPDLVVVGFYPVNDLHDKKTKYERIARERREHPIWTAICSFPDRHLYSYRYLDYFRNRAKRAYRVWKYSRPVFDAGPEELDDYYRIEWTSLYRDDFSGWKTAKESLADISHDAADVGASALLAVFPDLRSLQHYRMALRDRYYPTLESVAIETGFTVLDVFPAFREFEGREEEITLGGVKGGTHPNAEGFRSIAELLADEIESLGVIPWPGPGT